MTIARPPRLLVVIAQSPFDPASGAARSTLDTARLLARRGWTVHCIASTATESGAPCPVGGAVSGAMPHRLRRDGIDFELWPAAREGWATVAGAAMSDSLVRQLRAAEPTVLLTFGGSATEARWRALATAAGVHTVFAVHNEAYLHPDTPATGRAAVREGHLLLSPSEYLARQYREICGAQVAVLPPPLDWASVRAPRHEAVFTVFVNPEPAKGLMFVVRLFDELARRRPDIPLLVVESRGRAEHLFAAARRGGIDLAAHAGLFVSPALPTPAEVLANARLLVMPSVWEEPAGRLACEAMVNGVVPLVGPRGGLPEMVGDAIAPLPLPAGLTMATRAPVDAPQVATWREAIEHYYDNEAAWQAASDRCRAYAARHYDEASLAERYDVLFRALLH